MDKAIGAASSKAIKENYSYYQVFMHLINCFAEQFNPFELCDRRIKQMDKNGIDMEILSHSNTTQSSQRSVWVTLNRIYDDEEIELCIKKLKIDHLPLFR